MDKIYCYVDESGQHTHGEYFLVSVLITDEDRETIEQILFNITRPCSEPKKTPHSWLIVDQHWVFSKGE
jgi:hypothetical protein